MKRVVLLFVLVFCFQFSRAQMKIVSGKVSSEGEPVSGVTIRADNTNYSTISDFDGFFSFEVPEAITTIVVMGLGYEEKRITLNGEEFIEIDLNRKLESLKKVVVQGFSNRSSQARRRAESVQGLPESVTTFTTEDLDVRGIDDLKSFANFIPNVSFLTAQTEGSNFLTIRGIPTIRNGESPAAFVIDGVTVQDPNLLNQDLYDMAMIEVVKGPQGALYGKNAIAGAINFVTESPTNSHKNKIELGYEKGNEYKIGLSSSGPVLKNKLYYKFGGIYKHGDGVFRNEFLNRHPDFIRNASVKGELRYNISPSVTATLSGQYFDTKSGAIYYAHARDGKQMAPNDFNSIIDSDILGEGKLSNGFGSLKIEAVFDKFKLQSVTSYNNGKRFYVGDLDYLPEPMLKQDQTSNSETFNEEIRLFSVNEESKLTWSVGTFFQSTKKPLITNTYIWTGDNYELSNLGRLIGVMSDNFPISDYINKFNTVALFGFGDYKISERLTFSAGFRFDNDRLSQNNIITERNPSRIDAQFQPKFSISYQMSKDFLVFANYGRGYRSGGYNQDATAVFDSSYKPEITDSYEIGVKTSAWDDRFIFNTSFFYTDFKNQQQYISVFGNNGALIGNYNYGKSKSLGFEGDVKVRISRYLDLLGSFGFTDAKIVKGGSAGTTDRTSFKGNKIPFVPQNNYSIIGQSKIPINKGWDLIGVLNLHGTGKIYWHDDNKDVSPSYTLFDARIQLSSEHFAITFYGKNIFNKKYYTEYYSGVISGSEAGDIAWYGKPSIFGSKISFKF